MIEIKFIRNIRGLLFYEQGRHDADKTWFKVVVTDYKTWYYITVEEIRKTNQNVSMSNTDYEVDLIRFVSRVNDWYKRKKTSSEFDPNSVLTRF